MNTRWKLWVEGPSDKAIMCCLLRRMNNVESVEPAVIGGGVTKIAKVAPLIRRSSDGGQRVAMILDANSDFQQTFDKAKTEIERLDLPVERQFLLPDNEHSGSLETLLEQMAVSSHQVIYGCLDRYGDCLRAHDKSYRPPDSKGRLYAYCEALDIETNADRRDYTNESHWNLDAHALEPLKRFLRALC